MQMGAGARFWVSILVSWVGMSSLSLVRAGMLPPVKIFEADTPSQKSASGAVEGRVMFQKRFTKVLHEECRVEPCLESQAYWSVLIQSQDRSFLVNQRFQIGKSQAPWEVELGGVVLREGMWVRLEGAIYAYSLNLFVISELQKVRLLSELGWACHSLDEEGSSLFVRVWKEEGLEQEVSPSLASGYRMRVQEVSGKRVQTLADVRQVDVWVVGQGLLFYGQSAEPKRKGVQLWIQDQSQGLRGLPSQLTLFEGSEQEREGTTSEASEDMKNAPERRVRMSCSRTRS